MRALITGVAGFIGSTLAERLLGEGASEILVEVRSAVAPAVTEPG